MGAQMGLGPLRRPLGGLQDEFLEEVMPLLRPEGWAGLSLASRWAWPGRKSVPSSWRSTCEWTGNGSSSEWLERTVRGLGVDSKPELQRVLEHRRRNQLIKKKKEELEAKRLQCPFEQELLRRQQRLNQLEKPPEKEEDRAPEFIKVRENLRRIATLTSEERAL
ncbi:actin-associated protein FAM107A isoform X3 [Camelus bactrianus]|uniref:Actin-associated protein FAM107A isoform X3 n=1 Tax=Camelus bactrianus TaxID=9837 RepID=A0AC58NSC6_CAMBA